MLRNMLRKSKRKGRKRRLQRRNKVKNMLCKWKRSPRNVRIFEKEVLNPGFYKNSWNLKEMPNSITFISTFLKQFNTSCIQGSRLHRTQISLQWKFEQLYFEFQHPLSVRRRRGEAVSRTQLLPHSTEGLTVLLWGVRGAAGYEENHNFPTWLVLGFRWSGWLW